MDNKNKQDIPKDIQSLSFEGAIKELETIVRELETGETSLDDSIKVYERGNLLRRHLSQKLADAKARVETIQINDQGVLQRQNFDDGE